MPLSRVDELMEIIGGRAPLKSSREGFGHGAGAVSHAEGDQMRRALASVALNSSEGAGNQRGNRRLRFETASGSAKESRSAYEVAAAFGYVALDAALVDRLDRIAATMYRLGRPAS